MLKQLHSWWIQAGRGRWKQSIAPTALYGKADSERSHHPQEEPPIKPSHFGEITLQTVDQNPWLTENGDPLMIQDLYSHTIVFGESGSGKTFYVLNQLLDQLFCCTHLPDGVDREGKKLGGLVIEAKGDFTPKTWALAQKYGRMDDLVYFGPNHLDQSYDMFGDPTESPVQLADKMIQLLTAFGGGKKSEDPFWDNAARKLFTHLFLLHRAVRRASASEVPAMSFELLNLLILDRGLAHNQVQLEADRGAWEKAYGEFLSELRVIRSLLLPLRIELANWERVVERFRWETHVTQRELTVLQPRVLEEQDSKGETLPSEYYRRQQGCLQRQALQNILESLLVDPPEGDRMLTLSARLETLQESVHGFLNSPSDEERGQHYQGLVSQAFHFSEKVWPRLANIQPEQSNLLQQSGDWLGLRSQLLGLMEHLTQARELGEQILNWPTPEEEVGTLRRLLNRYGELLTKSGKKPAEDSLFAYFHEEYLNVVNDKTSGSVGMVASNLVTLFVHPPFNQIFSAQPTFSMAKVIDEGKVVVLDMPLALYGASARIAALVLKIDFFRAMLSRGRLSRDLRVGEKLPTRLINQERPMTYFCDEFASIASTGETTGEAGFLDKVREFRCCCILGLQSIPMLLKRFSEAEVEAILTNCANKIFLRNSDPRTNEMAAKLFGQQYRVNLNRAHTPLEMALNAEMPIGKEGFTASYSLGNRVESGEFSRLRDGEAYIRLNPRFGRNQIGKLSLVGCPIEPLNPRDLFPLPYCSDLPQRSSGEAYD